MRARNRTINRPMFEGHFRSPASWNWIVTMRIGPSGYVRSMHVIAERGEGVDRMVGTAQGDVPAFCDVHEAMEILATEAMMGACEPTLFGDPPTRIVDVSSLLTD